MVKKDGEFERLWGKRQNCIVQEAIVHMALTEETKKRVAVESEITELLKNGGGSGDNIQDFCFSHGIWEPDSPDEKALRLIEGRLGGHCGQLVLTCESKRRPLFRSSLPLGGGPFGEQEYSTTKHYQLGVLDSEKLGLAHGSRDIEIAVKGRYVRLARKKKSELVTSETMSLPFDSSDEGEWIVRLGNSFPDSRFVVAGDDKVIEALEFHFEIQELDIVQACMDLELPIKDGKLLEMLQNKRVLCRQELATVRKLRVGDKTLQALLVQAQQLEIADEFTDLEIRVKKGDQADDTAS